LFVCVGLDPRPSQIPASITGDTPVDRVVSFCQFIVEATTNHALAFKINTAFFEGLGASGIEALYRIRASMLESSPEVPLILDYKRGDIGDTNEAYAQFAESLQADAVTINPYLGMNANIPWLKRTKLGVIVLCRTCNPGSDEFQERRVSGW
jgi:orotidine-5'-phosphate decarboxylase